MSQNLSLPFVCPMMKVIGMMNGQDIKYTTANSGKFTKSPLLSSFHYTQNLIIKQE